MFCIPSILLKIKVTGKNIYAGLQSKCTAPPRPSPFLCCTKYLLFILSPYFSLKAFHLSLEHVDFRKTVSYQKLLSQFKVCIERRRNNEQQGTQSFSSNFLTLVLPECCLMHDLGKKDQQNFRCVCFSGMQDSISESREIRVTEI